MRIAVVGAGRMGRCHGQVIKSLGLDLVGIADPLEEARVLAITECGLIPNQVHEDASSMLRALDPECVVVATTAPTHAAFAVEAIDLGARYVLCEKPLATSLADCDRILAASEDRGASVAVNHQMRFMEQYTTAKNIVESDSFGGLCSVTVVAGNFGLAMNGSHYFEMFRYMTGESVERVSAWLSKEKVQNRRGPQFEDQAGQVRAETASGKRLYMEIGDDQGQGVHVIYGGRCGQLVANELTGSLYLMERAPEYRAMPTTRYAAPWKESSDKVEPTEVAGPTRDVLCALLKGDNYPTVQDGRSAVASLVAACMSNEQGHRAVAIEETVSERDRMFPWA